MDTEFGWKVSLGCELSMNPIEDSTCPRCGGERQDYGVEDEEWHWICKDILCRFLTVVGMDGRYRQGGMVYQKLDTKYMYHQCQIHDHHLSPNITLRYSIRWLANNTTRICGVACCEIKIDKHLPFTITKDEVDKYLLLV